MTTTTQATSTTPHTTKGLAPMGLAALGVVFGDIGTSPLYTMKTVLTATGAGATPEVVMGSLSLIVWTLIIITWIKYVAVAMRIDNDGEGGILALMSLLGVKHHARPMIVAAGLFGAALIYGDGAITPAISVLSALEGLDAATPAFKPYIVPLAVAILAGLFVMQPQGTARIGRAFGPVMLLWFVVIAVLGIRGIAQHPSVLAAINPKYAFQFLFSNGWTGYLVLGAVFLCVTGAEALYADMGHFGAAPIRLAWTWIVFPSLVLSYAGQASYVLDHGASDENIFYQLCPDRFLVPMVVLSTIATIIASQAIITGAFSMTRQAIHLGWMPRLRITQTSEEGYGQIYVAAVNWLLMIATIALVLFFQKSDNLASAYGIAVSTTMLMTTVLLYIAMREIWHWDTSRAAALAGFFFVVDAAFLGANSVKILDGGWVPIVIAAIIYGIMYIWHRGADEVRTRNAEASLPIEAFIASLPDRGIARVRGTAVFFTRTDAGAPPIITWYVDHAHALQRSVVAITIDTLTTPYAEDGDRFSLHEEAPSFWRCNVRFGFMERPDMQTLLTKLAVSGCPVDREDVTYFVGIDIAGRREDGQGLPFWFVRLFSVLVRSSTPMSDMINLPRARVVQLGRRVAL
jgi:KUP system potassium uptake protein